MSGDFERIRNEKESYLNHFGTDFWLDGLAVKMRVEISLPT